MDDRTEQHTMPDATDHFARDFTERTERAAQINATVIANQAETIRHMWQTSVDIASTLTTRSAEQVGCTFGLEEQSASAVAHKLTPFHEASPIVTLLMK